MKINIGLLGALTILFVALKLTGVISWSWWWVLCPLWLPAVLVILILFIILCLAAIASKL